MEENCLIRPSYNYSFATTATYCNKHKKENMIDIKSKKCEEENCLTQPVYNYPSEIKAIYCNTAVKF